MPELKDYSTYFEKPDGIYALSHSVGPLTVAARNAIIHAYLNTWSSQGGDAWPQWLSSINDFCQTIGQVVNASENEICPQTNLASGFHRFLTAIAKLETHKHQTTILMHKDAFASMGFVVSGLAATYRLKLVLIDAPVNDMDAWYSAFEKHSVLACLITHVHSNTSHKSDVKALCRVAKQFEAFACVDVAQSIGIVPIDVKDWQVDAIFGSCVKWLCGGPGAGFIFINNNLMCLLEPDNIGWFSHQNPFEFVIEHYQAASSAKRFWGGTPSIAPYIIANASIQSLLNIGLHNLVAHNRKLKRILVSELSNVKDVVHPTINIDELGGSMCLAANNTAKVIHKLGECKVKYDQRDGLFRISLHLINSEQDANVIADCFK